MIASVFAGSAVAAEPGQTLESGPFSGRVNPDGASVTLTKIRSALGDRLELPSTLGSLPVTALGSVVFTGPGDYTMKTVVVPASVESIAPESLCSPNARTLTAFEVAGNNPVYEAVNGVLYEKEGDRTLVAYPQAKADASYTVPEGVKAIGAHAFYAAKKLSSVVLPDGLLSLGDGAFAASGLTGISFPGSVSSIGLNLFADCASFSEAVLTMPNIPQGIFKGNQGLTRVTLAGTVTSIGAYAFENCDGLTSVSIPGSVKSIGRSAFSGCDKLTSVTLNEGLETIEYGAFRGVPITAIRLPETLSDLGDSAFISTKLESLEIPAGLTKIGSDAFNSTALTTVTIPATVRQMGMSAFAHCRQLTSAVVEAGGMTALPGSTFNQCEKLTAVSLPDGLLSLGSSAFNNCSSLEEISLPVTLTSIGSNAFANCPLRTVELPEGITTLSSGVFGFCRKLQSVRLPSGLRKIDSWAFEQCTSLQSVTLPASVTDINNLAFYYCTSLCEIIFQGNAPANVSGDPFPQTVGRRIYRPTGGTGYDRAPWSAMDVRDIAERPETIVKKPVQMDLTASLSHSRQDELILWMTLDITPRIYDEEHPISPVGGVTTYIQVQGEEAGAQPEAYYYQGGNTNTFRTFGYNMKNYIGKTISVTVVMDESACFQQGVSNTVTGQVCGLSDIAWDQYVPFGDSQGGAHGFDESAYGYIQDAARGGIILTALDSREATTSSVVLPESVDGLPVTALGDGLFQNCVTLQTVSIPETVQSIGADCFSGCVSLSAAELPEGLTELGAGAFRRCSSLTSATLPAGLAALHRDAFTGSGLTAVALLGDAPALDDVSSPFPEGTVLTVSPEAAGYDVEPWLSLLDSAEPEPNPEPEPEPDPEPNPDPVPDSKPEPDSPGEHPNVPVTPPSTEPDPPKPVVESTTAADGTVTQTTAWPDGKTAVAVKTPQGDKNIVVTAASGETLAQIVLPSEPGPAKEFEDVKADGWYKGAVDTASSLGLFSGTGAATFSPAAPLTRGMLVTTLHRLSGEAAYGVGQNSFPDVKADGYCADAADWAKAAGIATGKDSGFDPDGNITREQLVTMLYRYAGLIGADGQADADLDRFPDGGSVSPYAEQAMKWAVKEGIIQGKDGKIAPKGFATRAEVAAVLTRFVDQIKQ